jgi:hypothetical protein
MYLLLNETFDNRMVSQMSVDWVWLALRPLRPALGSSRAGFERASVLAFLGFPGVQGYTRYA